MRSLVRRLLCGGLAALTGLALVPHATSAPPVGVPPEEYRPAAPRPGLHEALPRDPDLDRETHLRVRIRNGRDGLEVKLVNRTGDDTPGFLVLRELPGGRHFVLRVEVVPDGATVRLPVPTGVRSGRLAGLVLDRGGARALDWDGWKRDMEKFEKEEETRKKKQGAGAHDGKASDRKYRQHGPWRRKDWFYTRIATAEDVRNLVEGGSPESAPTEVRLIRELIAPTPREHDDERFLRPVDAFTVVGTAATLLPASQLVAFFDVAEPKGLPKKLSDMRSNWTQRRDAVAEMEVAVHAEKVDPQVGFDSPYKDPVDDREVKSDVQLRTRRIAIHVKRVSGQGDQYAQNVNEATEQSVPEARARNKDATPTGWASVPWLDLRDIDDEEVPTMSASDLLDLLVGWIAKAKIDVDRFVWIDGLVVGNREGSLVLAGDQLHQEVLERLERANAAAAAAYATKLADARAAKEAERTALAKAEGRKTGAAPGDRQEELARTLDRIAAAVFPSGGDGLFALDGGGQGGQDAGAGADACPVPQPAQEHGPEKPEQPRRSRPPTTSRSSDRVAGAAAAAACPGASPDPDVQATAPVPVPAPVLASMKQMDAEAPGGIDFSSLELRYLAIPDEGERLDVDYAFRARRGGRGTTLRDGVESVRQASDAFFVWLALPRSSFWVNLNPDQPDRIMDPRLARTEVGRILLEADFALKRHSGRLMHPESPTGERLWRAVGWRCIPAMRLWITPGTAKVRSAGDELYILDAPLRVDVEEFRFRTRPDVARADLCAPKTAAQRWHAVARYRQIVLPHLRRIVNRAPEFAALRRVYLSRVAAEWYRERSEDRRTAYAGVIDSGRIDRWRYTGSWRPEQTFRRMVRSFKHGDYRYTRTWTDGSVRRIWTVQVGGVDFMAVPQDQVGDRAFERHWAGLADGVRRGLADGAGRAGADHWLGGTSQVDREAVQREFPVRDDGPGDDRDLAGLARSAAPYVLPALVLLGLLLVLAAGVRSRRRQSGAQQRP